MFLLGLHKHDECLISNEVKDLLCSHANLGLTYYNLKPNLFFVGRKYELYKKLPQLCPHLLFLNVCFYPRKLGISSHR